MYLAPLIDDFNDLWNDGIILYDASNKSKFFLKIILMWEINEFPAYGNLLGCVVKGKFACPACVSNIYYKWLKHSCKNVYMGHHRYLPKGHKFRKNRAGFDGKEERGDPLVLINDKKVWSEVTDFGKPLLGKRK